MWNKQNTKWPFNIQWITRDTHTALYKIHKYKYKNTNTMRVGFQHGGGPAGSMRGPAAAEVAAASCCTFLTCYPPQIQIYKYTNTQTQKKKTALADIKHKIQIDSGVWPVDHYCARFYTHRYTRLFIQRGVMRKTHKIQIHCIMQHVCWPRLSWPLLCCGLPSGTQR